MEIKNIKGDILLDVPGKTLYRMVGQGANLELADLMGMIMDESYLHGANLSCADLRRVSFRGACLETANLAGARAAGADFTAANLRNADLTWTDLRRAVGDGVRICSAQLICAGQWPKWLVWWIGGPDGHTPMMALDDECHSVKEWYSFEDDRDISPVGNQCIIDFWWSKKDHIKTMLEAFPAAAPG